MYVSVKRSKAKNRIFSGLLAWMMILSMFPVSTASAAQPEPDADDVIPISTMEDLLGVLSTSPSAYHETVGKTYQLSTDIVVDTSSLETTFASDFQNSARVFGGVLDGNGYTITVKTESDALLHPLFDALQGKNDQPAGVKDLTLVFEGDVEGTTIAALVSYVEIENVSISFPSVSFAYADDSTALATGVFGRARNGIHIRAFGISVKGGTIGSDEAQDAPIVMAAGIYSEWNAAGGEISLQNIQVEADDIRALSKYSNDGQYAVCNAAGVVSGYNQSNARIGNTSVSIKGDIYAAAANGSTVADVGAYGIGFSFYSLYNCMVEVGGNIVAIGADNSYSGNGRYDEEKTVSAAGLGFYVTSKYNANLFSVQDTGICSVSVGGAIRAEGRKADGQAIAVGGAVWTAPIYTWRNMTIEAGKIQANTYGTCEAYAAGFLYNPMFESNQSGDDFDYDEISINADEISAYAENSVGYAAGFAVWGYGAFKNCSVNAESIESYGAQSAASCGFALSFSPITSYYRASKTGSMNGCTVNIQNLISKADISIPDAWAEAYGLAALMGDYHNLGITGAVNACAVTISGRFSAEGAETCRALLVGDNSRTGFSVLNNNVSLQRSQAEIEILHNEEYVHFIDIEAAGRAGETPEDTASWESGNTVNFIDADGKVKSINDIYCRYDEGSAETGTLWKISGTASYYAVSYDLDGGVGADGANYDTQTVSAGTEITANAAPSKNGYKFIGWSDGTLTYQPGAAITVAADIILTALWQEDMKQYTVSYELNGGIGAIGVSYDPQTVSAGTEITVNPAPSKYGYKFIGWSDGILTYQPGTAITVEQNITLTALWLKNSGGTGAETVTCILHYDSNGGTQYEDERYASGVIVNLDKVPVRRGYIFTGWYADEDLTEKITSIKMTGSKTVYAGWQASSAVPDMLNGDDHFAYIVGYADGTVRPGNNISRAETAVIFFRLLNDKVRDNNFAVNSPFEDVERGMWYNAEISTMAGLGILSGRSTGEFDPNAPITRAEFAAICARFDTTSTSGNRDFTDISGHWAEAEIERAAALGWISGYMDGTFRPDQYITRAEAMTIINHMLCRNPESESDLIDGMKTWPDNTPADWHYLAVQEATNSHVFIRKDINCECWTALSSDPDWTRYQD